MTRTANLIAAVAGAVVAFGATGGAAATTSASPARADGAAAGRGADGAAIVVDWNRELLDVLETPGAQPQAIHPTRSYAILQAAIHDAVTSITGHGEAIVLSVDAPRGARPDAAAAGAGHAVLTVLYPALAAEFDRLLADELAGLPGGRPTSSGLSVGERVASLVLAARAGDGSGAAAAPFVPGPDPGDYQPTPPAFADPVFRNWASVRPFVLERASQFRPAPPPSLTSERYAEAINEVKALGRDTSSVRTPEQTTIGRFWNPPIWNTWNAIAERAAVTHHASLVETTDLFAALDVAFADSTIALYDAKYHTDRWRPVTAIRHADEDGNPATTADPSWLPLTPTAPDPSDPGAHSAISAAGAVVLAAFFGDRDTMDVMSPSLPGVTRSFGRYSALADEAGLSRIFAGQHTRIDDQDGRELGSDVARFVLRETRLTPTRNGGGR